MLAETIASLITLVAMEVILGIDNIIFISILADKLPAPQGKKLRILGLSLAMIVRLLLLTAISWVLKLDNTLFVLFSVSFSGKSLILLAGGLFLIYKSTREILHKTEAPQEGKPEVPVATSFRRLLLEIILLDVVFSVDSIITAVGMANELWIMYTSVIFAVVIMLFASAPIGRFITRHPSFKILALCFLMMIGVALIAEGLHFKIPKGYIYFSMGFAFLVDIIQMRKLKQ